MVRKKGPGSFKGLLNRRISISTDTQVGRRTSPAGGWRSSGPGTHTRGLGRRADDIAQKLHSKVTEGTKVLNPTSRLNRHFLKHAYVTIESGLI